MMKEEIKFGTDGYGNSNSRFRLTKHEDGDVRLTQYDPHNGLPKDSVYIPKEDIQTLIKLLSNKTYDNIECKEIKG